MLKFLLKRKIIVGLGITFIFVFGLLGLTKLDKELFPPLSFDQTLVSIEAEDMPANDVENLITIPIETALDNIDGVESFHSSSTIGNSTFFVNLEKGKGEQVTKDIETTVNGMQDELYGVTDTFVMQATTDQPFEFFMDISGDELGEISDFATNVLKPRLEALPEVREVELAGIEEKEINITLKHKKLAELNIQQAEVLHALQEANKDESIGELTKEKNEPTLRWNHTFKSIDEIKNISIPTESGIISLKEIASVKEDVSKQSHVAWKNGSSDFILIQVGRTNAVTQVDMASAVRAEVDKIKSEKLADDVVIEEIAAQADYVDNAIDGVSENIIIGGIIAIVVLLLFLRNIRATIIVSLSIPASILLTVLMMGVLDYSLNLASLIGLGLGIGMMVDASIVVLESIYKKKEQGYPNKEAVIVGTKEVASAVISSMLTTIVVFLPIGLLDDEIGKIVLILSIVIAVTLISSVLVSFTWIPTLSENFLKVKQKKEKKRKGLVYTYGRIIKWITKKKRRRIGFISVFFAMFISSFLLLSKVPMSVMPDILDRYAEVVIELDSGVTPDEREDIAQEINKQIKDIDDVERHITIDNVEVLVALINMTPEEEKTREQKEVNEEIMRKLRSLEENYPIANVMSTVDGVAGFPVEVVISGEDFHKIKEISEQFQEDLLKVDGIVSAKIDGDTVDEELGIELNNKKLKDDGLDQNYIYESISQRFMKVPVGDLLVDGISKPIQLTQNIDISNKKDLLDQKIFTPVGEKKLSNYITLENIAAPTQIDRQDGERYMEVTADYEDKDFGTINRDIQQLINDFDVENGYKISVSGDLEQQQEAAQDLFIIFAISLFLVFVVMAIQFNSLKHPLIILSIIPLTVTGVIVGLFITQKDLNVMSGIGVIMLIGIVLNNGILLIDRVKQLRNKGMDVNEAVVSAGVDRIRPIFMTTLTTVGGMIPLALATGTSSGYQSPLAVVIISGLLFATLITLFLIPSIYLLFEDIGSGLNRLLRKKSKKVDTKETAI